MRKLIRKLKTKGYIHNLITMIALVRKAKSSRKKLEMIALME